MWLEKDGESMKGVRSLSSAICLVKRARRSCRGVGDHSQQWGGVFASWSVSLQVQQGLIFKPTFQILLLLLNFVESQGCKRQRFGDVKKCVLADVSV